MSVLNFLRVSVFFICMLALKAGRVDRSHVDVNSIPDTEKNTVDFIEKYGYPAEMHEVLTKDNYVLTLHRIPHNGKNSAANRPVVLLQHGIVLSSDQWVLRGPSEDLVFLLSRKGYDVWMSNTRGTQYSRHLVYSKNDFKFWNYSLDELGNYDLSAIIDYVLSVTGKPHLTYVGHSRGVAMAVILLSSQPEYNSKINVFLGIAPVIYSKEAKCPLFQLAGNRPSALMKTTTLKQILQRAQVRNLLFTTRNMRMMLNRVCKPGAVLDNVCPYISFFINGEDFQMFNKVLALLTSPTAALPRKETEHLEFKSRIIKVMGLEKNRICDSCNSEIIPKFFFTLPCFAMALHVHLQEERTLVPLMISHFTLGVGAKELLHLLQISESDVFRPFDNGRKNNLQIYGTEEPQPYKLENILVPTYLYYGPNDLFVSERDFFKFAKQLSNFKEAYRVPYEKFNHIDYIFAKNANSLLYPHILAVISKYNPSRG